MTMTLRLGAIAVASVGASLMLAPAVQAQTRTATGLTFGKPTREIAVDLTGDVTYDTNVARVRESSAAARGLEKEDVRFSPGANLDISLPAGPAVFSLTGTVGYNFYARNTQLNRERIGLDGNASARLAVCDVSVGAQLDRRQSDLADLSLVPGNPKTSSENVQTAFTASGALTCGGNQGLRPTAFINRTTNRNSDVNRRLSDANLLSYGGGVSYSSPAFGIVTAFIGRSEYSYPRRNPLVTGIGIDEFDSTLFGVSLDRRLGARLQVNGQISYVKVDGAGGLNEDASGLNWDVGAALTIGSRARLTLGFARTLEVSNSVDVNFAKTTAVDASLEYVLTPRLRLTARGGHRTRDFNSDGIVAPLLVLGDDSLNEIGGLLSYTRGERLSFVLGVTYQKRAADLAIYDYDALRLNLGTRLRL